MEDRHRASAAAETCGLPRGTAWTRIESAPASASRHREERAGDAARSLRLRLSIA